MRLDLDTYREIADSLVRNKSRSILTGFGIFWGLFMLLFLVGGSQGLKAMLSKNFDGFATNATIIWSQNTSLPYMGLPEGRYWSMQTNDIERLKMMVPELDVVTPLIGNWGLTAEYDGRSTNCNIKAVKADYSKVEEPRIKYGRFINEVDVAQERKVCMIGERIYNDLFPGGEDPCGAFLNIGGIYYQVVGLNVAEGNFNINGPASETAIIPFTVGQKVYSRGDSMDIICMTGKKGVTMSGLEKRIRQVMGRKHMFDPADEPAMSIINTEQLFSMMDNLFKGVNMLFLLVGLGTLLAGSIGVSNIMMVTVRERTVEIGIRRAIGATPREILSQIMMESVALTIAAGSAGIVFSVLVLNLVETITKHQAAFQVSFWTAVLALILLVILGVLAGLAPASRAMAIKPVDAMRDE